MCGVISATRFFQESMVVSEYRCLPEQSGFTFNEEATNLLGNYDTSSSVNVFSNFNLARRDLDVVIEQSCSGWYWGMLPSFFVGLTLRAIACVFLHILNRGQQAKKKYLDELRASRSFKNYAIAIATILILVLLAVLTGYFIIRGDLSGQDNSSSSS